MSFSTKASLFSFANGVILFPALGLFIDHQVNYSFWFSLSMYFLLLYYGIARKSHAIQYYASFIIYVLFFGYFVQTSLEISYLDYTSRAKEFNPYLVYLSVTNTIGMILGSEFRAITTNRGKSRSELYCREFSSEIKIHSIPFLLLLVLLAMLLAAVTYSFDAFLANRVVQFTGEALSAPKKFFLYVFKFLPFVAVAAILCGQDAARKNRRLWLTLLFLTSIFALVVSNPVNSARFISLTSISIVVVFYLSHRIPADKFSIYLCLLPWCFALLLPVTSQLRYGFENFTLENTVGMYSSLEFSSMQMLIAGVDLEYIQPGSYTLSGLLSVVPREFFSNKTGSLGITIAEQSGFTMTNVAVPSFFVAYADAGLLGVFLFSAASGYFLNWSNFANQLNWRRRSHFYRVAMLSLVPIFARGDFSTFAITFYALLVAYELIRPMSSLTLIANKRTQTRDKNTTKRPLLG